MCYSHMESIALSEVLEELKKAVSARKKTSSTSKAHLRNLDERVCGASRELYTKYKEHVILVGRSIDRESYELVDGALLSALKCVPDFDYSEQKKGQQYSIKTSLRARLNDLRSFSARLLEKEAAAA